MTLGGDSTALERALRSDSVRRAGLKTDLAMSFDPHSGLQYLRRDYLLDERFVDPDAEPSSEWIGQTLASFVRGEFGQGRSVYRPVGLEPVFSSEREIDPLDLCYEYLNSCERDLVFSGYASAVARQGGQDDIERFYSLLTHPLLGNALNGRHIPLDAFRSSMSRRIVDEERLMFAFPAFPFKDQNRFRTTCSPGFPDLGEVALLIRLHTLSVAIYQVYHLGAEWLLLTDGSAYSRALRVNPEHVRDYEARLVGYRDRLDLGRAVSIVNLLDICHALVGGEERWRESEDQIASMLTEAGRSNSEAMDALENLTYGMKRNVNLDDVRDDLSWSRWWDVITAPRDEVDTDLRDKWDEVHAIAAESAVRYAAFNLALRHFRVEAQLFPHIIRATIHPKPGQVAVPKLGAEFPWNGTAVIDGLGPATVENVSTVAYRDLGDRDLCRLHGPDGETFAVRRGPA